MTRAHRPVLRSAADGARVPGAAALGTPGHACAPLRMTAEMARTGATQHGIATPRATPTQYDVKERNDD